MTFTILPTPRSLTISRQTYPLSAIANLQLPANASSSLLQAAVVLAGEWERICGKRLRFSKSPQPGKAVRLCLDSKITGTESYSLEGSEQGLDLRASTETGLFYAIQSLRQLIATGNGIYPACKMQDAPDFRVRGFYHDITRGAVPTLETLFQLADKLAYYKINQLQLYVEHTFAFAKHCDIWEGSDPITAEEILRLDAYCQERHIELVPSLSTFGHFYMGLRSRRKECLNELEVSGGDLPFSFIDRMRHYTLNCKDARSLKLVQEILEEFIPLFHSRYFNICCDETFDLGKGRNAEYAKKKDGTEKLYLEFLKKIIGIVEKNGKKAMFWGDIIGKRPDFIHQLPKGTIPLEWDYSASVQQYSTKQLVKAAGEVYICPGCTTWNHWLADINVCRQNIGNYARKGWKAGAVGLLNTNWGDYGNINLPATSLYGLIFGAQASWNVKASSDLAAFDDAIDRLEFRCKGLSALWLECSQKALFNWGHLQRLVDPSCVHGEDGFNIPGKKCRGELLPAFILQTPAAKCRAARKSLESVHTRMLALLSHADMADPLAKNEILFGMEMTVLTHEIACLFHAPSRQALYDAADSMRKLENRFTALWHLRNKPSEYYRNREILLALARKLDTLAEKF